MAIRVTTETLRTDDLDRIFNIHNDNSLVSKLWKPEAGEVFLLQSNGTGLFKFCIYIFFLSTLESARCADTAKCVPYPYPYQNLKSKSSNVHPRFFGTLTDTVLFYNVRSCFSALYFYVVEAISDIPFEYI